MIRNYKALGLALIALAAFAAIAAPGASAVKLTTGVANPNIVYFTGHQSTQHAFSNAGGTVKCTTATFTGSKEVEVGGGVSELTVTPAYSGCTAFGFATAHVTVNGCKYTFTTPTSIEPGKVTWHGSQVHIIDCNKDGSGNPKKIEITPTTFGVSACTQYVGEQTPTSGHVVGTNNTSTPMHVILDTTLEGIHYTGTGGLCQNSETHSDAKYTGITTTTCFSDKAHTIRVDCTFS